MRATILYAGTALPDQQVSGGTIPITVVLTPTKDNTLYESTNGAVSNGTGEYFFVGNTRSASSRRGLLAFDLAGALPSGATIVSATLQLQMSKTNGGISAVSLHRVLKNWGEGSSNASDPEGSGATATTNDATWLHSFYDTALWQTPGGDFVPTATATISVTVVGVYQWQSPALLADVQDWLINPTSNFGWVLVGNEAANSTAKRFDARENQTAANRPQLLIVYQTGATEQSAVYLPLVRN
jgi:hypothetical protein